MMAGMNRPERSSSSDCCGIEDELEHAGCRALVGCRLTFESQCQSHAEARLDLPNDGEPSPAWRRHPLGIAVWPLAWDMRPHPVLSVRMGLKPKPISLAGVYCRDQGGVRSCHRMTCRRECRSVAQCRIFQGACARVARAELPSPGSLVPPLCKYVENMRHCAALPS